MNEVKTVQINALIKAIKTNLNLMNYAIDNNDLQFIELYNKSLQRNIDVLVTLNDGFDLDYMQESILNGVVMAIEEIEEEAKNNV